jgi:hypothetical protein
MRILWWPPTHGAAGAKATVRFGKLRFVANHKKVGPANKQHSEWRREHSERDNSNSA